jgi:hypothetical protein
MVVYLRTGGFARWQVSGRTGQFAFAFGLLPEGHFRKKIAILPVVVNLFFALIVALKSQTI